MLLNNDNRIDPVIYRSRNRVLVKKQNVIDIMGKTYEIVRCRADGRCFYHAVAAGLNANAQDTLSLTEKWTAKQVFEETRTVFRDISRTWATDLDAQCVANALHINIHVWEGHNGMWTDIGNSEDPSIMLYNPFNVHFDALLRVQTKLN